jgi:dTDP-4-dehydrorhamnose reductase
MRLLIFGSRGQLGLELATRCEDKRISVVAASRDGGDIAVPYQVARSIRVAAPTVIINVAGYTDVDRAEHDRSSAFRENCDGPAIISRIAACNDIPLIHLSTDYVFDGNKDSPYTETDAVSPCGVYGASKAAGEEAVRGTWSKHILIRTAWLYGRYGNNFLKTMVRLSRTRKELGVVADQYGSPTATIDLADALLAVAARASTGESIWGTYHYAGSGTASRYDFACSIMESLNEVGADVPAIKPIATSDYPTLARRPGNSSLCCDLFANRFGIRPPNWQVRVPKIVRDLIARS